MRRHAVAAALVALSALVACAPAQRGPSATAAVSSAELAPRGRAHDIVLRAASCWLDGLWSDAVGEKPARREAATHERCALLLAAVDRPADDEDALRRVSPLLVDAIVRQLWRVSLTDERDPALARELASLLDDVANASREIQRMGVVVETVRAAPPAQATDRTAMLAQAQALRDASAVRSLLRARGPFAGDAHALGLMFALDRMSLARALPRGLAIDAVSGVFLDVFGVVAPKSDGSDAQWGDYLAAVASAAGHPVGGETLSEPLAHREAVAWDGILRGFAERLRASDPSAALAYVAAGAADRIDPTHRR
jgi:hypothetical protein